MSAPAHVVWFILSVLFPPLVTLWILCAICGGSSKRKTQTELMREQNELLRELKQQNMYRNYRD